MTGKLRWLPAAVVIALIVAVFLWTAVQPIEDLRASLVGFIAVSALCAALIPALHLWIDA